MNATRTVSKKSDFISYVRKYLIDEGLPCSKHCNKPTQYATLFEDRGKLVGAIVCPDNYVSRMVCFETHNDDGGISWFRGYVRNELGGDSLIRDKDFRLATRHGWELSPDAESEINIFSTPSNGVKEFYWTFYARDDNEKKLGNFLCEKCGKLFSQPLNSKGKMCKRH